MAKPRKAIVTLVVTAASSANVMIKKKDLKLLLESALEDVRPDIIEKIKVRAVDID